MPIEIESSPACCRKSLERIEDIYAAAGCLQEFLAAAPSLVKPATNVTIVSAIWKLGTGVWSWKTVRKSTSETLKPIVQNRVNQVVDFELLHHNNDADLSKQWTRIRAQLQR